jgi:putative addiction module component (TIGR02574 family)
MNMLTVSELVEEIKKLEKSERLLVVEGVWESIVSNNEEIPIHDWQKKELDKRYRDYKADTTKLHSVNDIHDEIKANLK